MLLLYYNRHRKSVEFSTKGENIEKIFENGFSTKGEGRGTGLYQIKATVENFGGTITVESQKDIGTSFSVSFKKD